MNKKVMIGVCSSIVVFLASSTLLAGDSVYRAQLNSRSASRALSGVSAPVLVRKAGPGTEAVVKTIADSLSVSSRCVVGWSAFKSENEANRQFLTGDNWTLSVSDQGQHLRFRTEPSEQLPRVPEASRPIDSSIESWGRAFISNELKDIVRLGPDDELVFLGTQYEVVVAMKAGSQVVEPAFVSEVAAVFGRRFRQADLVGAGSRIAVLMAVDSRISGFDVDWPTYEVSRVVENGADIETVEARSQQLSRGELERHSSGRVVRKQFECGYHDGGARNSVRTPEIHLACVAQYSAATNRGALTAIVEVIPAAREIPDNTWWPEAATLRGRPLVPDPSYAPKD